MKIHNNCHNPMIDFGLAQLPGDAPELTLLCPDVHGDRDRLARLSLSPEDDQAYILAKDGDDLILAGHPRGMMYGLIDIARAMRYALPLPMGAHRPAIQNRGIKFNIPLDARTPSYSDASDSAWANIETVWDMDFWRTLLDALALEKYNVVSLWSLHPFPSMVRVPGYEEVALEDVKRTREPVFGASMVGYGMYSHRLAGTLETVKRMTMDEKITFWRDVMDYGASRGISFMLFTWNIFVYGTEHTRYGITDEMDNPVTIDYFRKSVHALIKTYPRLAGIGVTAGERMSVGRAASQDIAGDLRWIEATYGQGINDALEGSNRVFRFIHRQHLSGLHPILNTFGALKVPLEFSFKYSQAHMYSDPHPVFARQFLEEMPEDHKTWLTLRNDDMYMLRWGGTRFAREYLRGIPTDKVTGFFMGPDGYTLGRDYLSRNPTFRGQPVICRQWYRTAIWGQLAYDPDTPERYFIGMLGHRTGCSVREAEALFELCETVSNVIPIVNQVHWHDFDFQNYPEGNLGVDFHHAAMQMGTRVIFHGIHDFLLAPAQPGGRYLGIAEAVQQECGELPDRDCQRSPDEAIAELRQLCDRAEELLADRACEGAEAQALLRDCRSMALLGRFYEAELSCALTAQRVYKGVQHDKASQAIALAVEAAERWEQYAEAVSADYLPQRLTRLNGRMADVNEMMKAAWEDVDQVRMLMEPFEPWET